MNETPSTHPESQPVDEARPVDEAQPVDDAQPAAEVTEAADTGQSESPDLSDAQRVEAIDRLLSHVWMVRAFLKHCEEAEEDDELCDVQRTLYDYMLALGGPLKEGNHAKYLKQAKKKLKKLKNANALFLEIQPEISSHTNFQMAAVSLNVAVNQIAELIESR